MLKENIKYILLLAITMISGSGFSSELCERLGEFEALPYKSDWVPVELYREFTNAGDKVTPCLIENITNTETKDIQLVPNINELALGDLAYFLLLRVHEIQFYELLPDPVAAEYEDQGVYTYFKFVDVPENREILKKRAKIWYKSVTTKSFGSRAVRAP